MKIRRVVGTVVSTINSPIYEDRLLLLCDVLDEKGQPTGAYTIGIDVVDAGAGEVVLIIDEGNSARQLLAAPDAPVRAVVGLKPAAYAALALRGREGGGDPNPRGARLRFPGAGLPRR